tara:strand:- start:489 stop:863 length:375 start_codon:yes stop_codon:yes gene_type:complete
MKQMIDLFISIVFCFSLIGAANMPSNFDGQSSHFEIYAELNKTQHDNIDDSGTAHTHTHKHTKDGEEHEHNHQHSKVNQYELKPINQTKHLEIFCNEFKSIQVIFEKRLSSTPHLLDLFRPPIV